MRINLIISKMMIHKFAFFALIATIDGAVISTEFDGKICDNVIPFTKQIRDQIRNTRSDVQKIIDFVLKGPDRGVTYNELAKFVDVFGPRMSGSKALEDAIDYMVKKLNNEGHDNVHTEEAQIPIWVYIYM